MLALLIVKSVEDYYCSWNDLHDFMNIPPDGLAAMAVKGRGTFYLCFRRFVAAFIDFPKPLIGLVNGPAVGVSVTVLGLFDAVFASDRVSTITVTVFTNYMSVKKEKS